MNRKIVKTGKKREYIEGFCWNNDIYKKEKEKEIYNLTFFLSCSL